MNETIEKNKNSVLAQYKALSLSENISKYLRERMVVECVNYLTLVIQRKGRKE